MLREARIVMPYATMMTMNGSEVWSTRSRGVHSLLKERLCAAFGGFTMTLGHGSWVNEKGEVEKDSVAIYDVAVDSDRDAPSDLIARFAMEAGKALDQQSVYVRYPNGECEIIDLEEQVATVVKTDRLLNALAGRQVDMAKEALEEVFGKGSVTIIGADIGDGRSAEAHETDQLYKELTGKDFVPPKPMPGELWATRGGEKVVIGVKASVMNGGWYVTVLEQLGGRHKVGETWVVNLDGKLANNPDFASSLDLVRRIH